MLDIRRVRWYLRDARYGGPSTWQSEAYQEWREGMTCTFDCCDAYSSIPSRSWRDLHLTDQRRWQR
jgi:hypothetical protein